MSEQAFQWAALPKDLLSAMAADYGADVDDVLVFLSEDFGPEPTDEFARRWWPFLLENWLRRDDDALYFVAAYVWQAGHFSGSMPESHNGQVHFLRQRKNSKSVREALVEAILIAGTDGEYFEEEAEGADPADAPDTKRSEPGRADTSRSGRDTETPRQATRQSTGLTLSELESRLWAAANALRGPVDPADFKNYVFPMLFWKWISDTWDWEHNQAVQVFGDDITPEVEADYHRFTLPDGTRWAEVTIRTDNLGTQIAKALGRIQQANPETLAGIFGDAAWGNKERLPESALVALVDAFTGLRLTPDSVDNDMLGQAYEYLLKNFADESGKKAGEFFTPRTVVHLAVGLLAPQPGESVYDPAAGSGGMLVETINSVRASGGDTRALRLYGQEINLTTAAIARMNLFLHAIEDFKIIRGDTLRNPGLRKPDGTLSTFDCVIANPPFSLANWGADLWPADPRSFCGVPPKNKGDFAWVQHMITSMDPQTGRVAVVMPHGVLFRGGVESRIRQCLVEQDRLEAVIGLPANLFYSTSIPACILVFRAEKPKDRQGHVLFVDGSARFIKVRNQNQMTTADVEVILQAFRTAGDPDGQGGVQVRLVHLDEITANDFDLNIGRYVKSAATEGVTLEAALLAYAGARAAREAAEAELQMRLDAAGIPIPGYR